LDECQRRRVQYYMRARNDEAVEASVRAIPKQEWREADVRIAHDDTRRAELADTTHAMNTGRHGFRLVAEHREELEEAAPDEELLVAVPRTNTRFLCIATNDMETSCAEVVAWYNRRQGASEQGNDRLKNDVCMGALPCRGDYGLEANRVFAYVCALLHNMFEWYKRECLPAEDQALRLTTLARHDMQIAARVTYHARVLTLHLASCASKVARRLERQIKHIRRAIKCMRIPDVAPAYAPLIYRRAVAAVCTVSGVPRRASFVRRI